MIAAGALAVGPRGPRGATGIRLSEADAACLFDEFPPAHLRDRGVRQVDVTGEVKLSASRGVATLSFVRFLRDATSAGIWVSWPGSIDASLDVALLCHLPPPLAPRPSQPGWGIAESQSAWRGSHEAGLCYYRVGPGFVQVTDRRPGAPPQTTVLSSPAELALFRALLVPGPLPEAAGELTGTRFLLRIGSDAVTLPHRLSCRPVPWNVF